MSKKMMAVHALQLGALVSGKHVVDQIAPGQAFLATDDEIKTLLHTGAIREPGEADKGIESVTRTSAAAALSQTNPGSTGKDVDISKLNKEKLIAIANAEGAQFEEGATNAELVKAIEDHRKSTADDLV